MGRTTTIYGSLEPVWGTKTKEGEVRRRFGSTITNLVMPLSVAMRQCPPVCQFRDTASHVHIRVRPPLKPCRLSDLRRAVSPDG